MYRFRRALVFVIVLVTVLAAIGTLTITSNANGGIAALFDGNPTATEATGYPVHDPTGDNPTDSARPIYEGDARALDTQKYADYFGVSFEEADFRLRMQDALGGLTSELAEKERDTFAGLWIQHTPEYRFVVMFTRDGENTIEPYLKGKPYADIVELREAEVTLAELHDIRAATLLTIENVDIPRDHSINVQKNRVELYVLDRTAFSDALQDADVLLPNHVEIIQVDGLSRETAQIIAGLAVGLCTTGFSTIWHGGLGISTAAHCANDQTYGGNNLPFMASAEGGNYDVQWHLAPAFWIRNIAWDGTYQRYINSYTPYDDQDLGEWVCGYGNTTEDGCGEITSKTRNGNYIVVHSDTEDLAEPGDSGGPWFQYNSAFGLMAGDIEPGNDGYYMTVDKMDILDLDVYTGKSSVYQHVFWSASDCTEYKTLLSPYTGNPDWESTLPYDCSTFAPGSGTIESYTTYVSGGKLREAMWRGGLGWLRNIPVNDDGTVDWTAAPSWVQCCSGGGPNEQGAYVTGGYLYQHVFWSASNCTEYRTELSTVTGDPHWWTTTYYPCNTSAPGSGTIESYTTYVNGGKLREAMWRGGSGWLRDVPLNDDGTVDWTAAPNWSYCCTGGGPSEQGAYVLSEP